MFIVTEYAALIVFHIPLCNVRQPYKGCPLTCFLAEISRNETVWRMRTNNVKRVYCFSEYTISVIVDVTNKLHKLRLHILSLHVFI